MASRARVEEYRSLNEDLSALAVADIAAAWGALDKTDIAAAREAITPTVEAVVATYGDIAALNAAVFYDDLRAESPNARGTFRATMSTDRPDAEALGETVRWAVAPLAAAEPDSDAALERLAGSTQRQVSQRGRDTLAYNTYRDPAAGAWARVPRGTNTCGFCRSLASRGPVYRTAETAGRGHDYHDRCRCVPTPIWDGDDLPEGYDPGELYDEYLDARGAADSGELGKIASELDAGRPR